MAVIDPAFWDGRRVLLTGHSGFKGTWLSLWLTSLGASVTGISSGRPAPADSLHSITRADEGCELIAADIRDAQAIAEAFASAKPEVVIHLAAQPLVRRAYADPLATYEINVMGTVNLLEAVRATPSVRAVVIVTSDNCYAISDLGRPYREDDPLGGSDPYASSKAAAELVTAAYRSSYFTEPDAPRLATARSGNVIGAGDSSEGRLIPDLVRSALTGKPAEIRNPDAIRPWQHVLNPISGYLLLAEALCSSADYAEPWNFAPDREDERPVRWIADRLVELWPDRIVWELDEGANPAEAHELRIDSAKAHERLGWRLIWHLDDALQRVIEWQIALEHGSDMRAVALGQIAMFTAAV